MVKRLAVNFFRGFIGLGVAFICFEVGCWFHPPLMAWGLGIIDPNRMCTSAEMLRGAQQHARVYDGGESVRRKARFVRSEGKLNLWESPVGNWWIPSGSDGPTLGFAVQQREEIYGSGEWGVRAGDIVLDCGANVGTYTRHALDRGAKLVVAIEPAPVNVECLRRNFPSEIASGRVIIAAVGVWDKEDILPLYEDPNNSGADSFVIRGPNDHATNARLMTIDQLAKEFKLPRVDFIKMDIKGATVKALQGGSGVISAHKPRLAISTEELEDPPAVIRSAVVSNWPSYKMACGVCSVDALKLKPDVLLFKDGPR